MHILKDHLTVHLTRFDKHLVKRNLHLGEPSNYQPNQCTKKVENVQNDHAFVLFDNPQNGLFKFMEWFLINLPLEFDVQATCQVLGESGSGIVWSGQTCLPSTSPSSLAVSGKSRDLSHVAPQKWILGEYVFGISRTTGLCAVVLSDSFLWDLCVVRPVSSMKLSFKDSTLSTSLTSLSSSKDVWCFFELSKKGSIL